MNVLIIKLNSLEKQVHHIKCQIYIENPCSVIILMEEKILLF